MPLLIKICGLRSPQALDVAIDSGADLVGFVFFAPSPRNLGLEAARTLGQRVQGRAGKVALTVDANDDTLLDIIAALKPDMLQLHGSETPERVIAVRTRFGLPVMKALPVAERKDLSQIRQYAQVVDRLIFDARPPKDATRPGGLGKTFDWTLLKDLNAGVPFVLSGGLAIVSDELAELPPERIAWLRRMLPSVSRAPDAGPARSGVPEELVTRFDDGSALYLRANLGDEAVRIELDLAALGFAGPTRVWDVFAEREVRRASGRLELGWLEPHASRLLRLVPDPADGRARLVGSSLHFSAGSLEAESVALEGPGVARVRLRLPGRREGEIALALPRAPDLVRAHVTFDDALELRLHALGVVNPAGISD
jgi:phosphoribosylanthranilate isomerase